MVSQRKDFVDLPRDVRGGKMGQMKRNRVESSREHYMGTGVAYLQTGTQRGDKRKCNGKERAHHQKAKIGGTNRKIGRAHV